MNSTSIFQKITFTSILLFGIFTSISAQNYHTKSQATQNLNAEWKGMMDEMKNGDKTSALYEQQQRKFTLYRIVVDVLYDSPEQTLEEITTDCLNLFDLQNFGQEGKYAPMIAKLKKPTSEQFDQIEKSFMSLVSDK